MIYSWTESYGERFFKGYDLQKLQRDQCYLTINNNKEHEVYLYAKYEDCIECPFYVEAGPIPAGNITPPIVLSTEFSRTFQVRGANSTGDFFDNLGEFGVYEYKDGGIVVLKEPVSIYFPILTVILIYAALISIFPILKFLKRVLFDRVDTYPIAKEEKAKDANQRRVQSLDTFRGISIVLMIFVNYGHGGYYFLEHAIWNGLCVGDLVFPWFLWIMGVCIPISAMSSLKRQVKIKDSLKGILKRSCILFGLGLFLGSPYLDSLRIFGVLQRFAVCYLVVATINILTLREENIEDKENKAHKWFKDIWKLRYQWIFMSVLILIYVLMIFLYEVPGCGSHFTTMVTNAMNFSGYFGPGGAHKGGLYINCTGGLTGYVDNVILGKHVYAHALITTIYKSQPFEPEGIFGCMTSIFQVFLGVQAGMILLTYKCHTHRLLRWCAWGLVLGLLAAILCNFSKEDGVIPINKQLWSLSFVLLTSSFAFFLLSICYVLVDVKHVWSGKPFLFAGMNAILMYVGHNMTYTSFPFHWYLSQEDVNRTHFMMLIENVWATSVWVLVSYYLYKIKYFLSI